MIIFVDCVDDKRKWLTILFQQKLIGQNGWKRKTCSLCALNVTTKRRKRNEGKSPASNNGGGNNSLAKRCPYILTKNSLYLSFLIGGANLWRVDRRSFCQIRIRIIQKKKLLKKSVKKLN